MARHAKLPAAVPRSWWTALDEALPGDLTPTLRRRIAFALEVYAVESARPPRARIDQAKTVTGLIASARTLDDALSLMQQWCRDRGLDRSVVTGRRRYETERETVVGWIALWEAHLADIRHVREWETQQGLRRAPTRGAPPDACRAWLAHRVFDALREEGLPLVRSRGGYLAEVLRVVEQAADRIDGRSPRDRRDLYRRLRALLRQRHQ